MVRHSLRAPGVAVNGSSSACQVTSLPGDMVGAEGTSQMTTRNITDAQHGAGPAASLTGFVGRLGLGSTGHRSTPERAEGPEKEGTMRLCKEEVERLTNVMDWITYESFSF